MRKKIATIYLLCAVVLGLALNGCGVGSTDTPTTSGSTISGVVTTDASAAKTVSLRDSSVPAQTRTTVINSNGSYSLNTSGLKTPYVLKTEWTDSSGSNQMYSIAEGNKCTNINPISDTAVIGASDNDDPDELYEKPDPERYRRSKNKFRDIVNQLRVVLAPLFALYETDKDPVSDDLEDDSTGLKALFKDVRIKVRSGVVIVTNKRTSGVIYEAPLSDIASGAFHPENMPGTPGEVNGATLYADKCASCHGPLATSSKTGATASQIQAAIGADTGGMGSLANLTALQIQAIATALATTPPLACTYTYSAWGTCQSDSTQTRTMLSSSPAGCVGTPVLSQSCTYVPPPPEACTYTYNAWSACQSDDTQTRSVASSSPAGCTGTPVLSQSCAYAPPPPAACTYTYNAWGACQSDDTQTRSVASSSPAGCTGTPVLSQSCTYVPPPPAACTYTYNAWGACQSDDTQTRSVASSSPTGCTGTPVLSQSCTYVPPPPVIDGAALYTQYCSGCHGNGKKGKSVSATQGAIAANRGGMGSLSFLTLEQITAISTAP